MSRWDKIRQSCCDPCTNKPGAGAPGNDVVGPSIFGRQVPLSNGLNIPLLGVIRSYDRYITRCIHLSDFEPVNPQVLMFDRRGESKTIQVVTSTPWRLNRVPDWLTIDPLEGDAGTTDITITAKKNPAFAEERSFALYVEDKATGEQISMIIIRQEEGYAIFVDPNSLYFGWDDTSAQALRVTANDSWEITEQPCKATIDRTSGASGYTPVLVSFPELNKWIDCVGAITFECGDAKVSVEVEHEGLREIFNDSNGEFFVRARVRMTVKGKTDERDTFNDSEDREIFNDSKGDFFVKGKELITVIKKKYHGLRQQIFRRRD